VALLKPETLAELLRDAARPLGVKEILRLAALHPGQQSALKRVLRQMVRNGALRREGKRFAVAKPARARGETRGGREGQKIEGILHMHRDGFGFVEPTSGEEEDIFLPPREAQRALDNDRVVVQVDRGQTRGRLLRVLDRRRHQVIGTYVERGKQAFVLANDASFPTPVHVPKTQLARDGDLVKVRLSSRTSLDASHRLAGEVSGSLGRPGDFSAEVLSIAFAQGFSDEFPAATLEEADGVPESVEKAELSSRRDLRKLPLVTIDGEDARDFDDAVYAAPERQGWRLVVAIADVDYYVREDSELDREALRRGTSVYLPDRVLPMLPERLSNGICSLRPHRDRFCLVAEMHFDSRARMRSFELYPGVIRSAARCTYDEVQALLDGKDVPQLRHVETNLRALNDLALALSGMRQERGAIDFDLPETRVILNADGKPSRFERRERTQSHRLIEECMLAANEAVAKFFQQNALPTIYRYHAKPDEEKLAIFAELAKAHGFALPEKGRISSRDLNRFLEQLEGHAESRALNQLLLRSMMQAIYSAKEVGHYGLGAKYYLHFTSPIRRYPDLIVHRQLRGYWAKLDRSWSKRTREDETEKLQSIAQQSTERERAAVQVEREVSSFYAAVLMKDRVGEEFSGTVSSVTDFGVFVELDGLWVEGLVKAQSLGPDFRFDQRLHQAVVPSSGMKLRIGKQLRVKLVSVNVARRQLDFEMLRLETLGGLRDRPAGRRKREAFKQNAHS